MKQRNEGFSLIETVVAIAILGLIVVPCCSALLMSIRINEKAQQMMHAQLAVSSAVETLMAEGITIASTEQDIMNGAEPKDEDTPYDILTGNVHKDENGVETKTDRFPDVIVHTRKEAAGKYYSILVIDNEGLVEITTTIRAKEVG